MCQLTLELDDAVVASVEAFAAKENTTVTTLVQRFLESLIKTSSTQSAASLEALQETFERLSRDMGQREWTRESLYER